MGQAKRRGADIQKWLANLSPEERQISDVAQRLFATLYRSFRGDGIVLPPHPLLHLYLVDKGIKTTPVVGYVNDGTDDVFISHA
jgi:hypothetical protein